jgi:hypothetical protein
LGFVLFAAFVAMAIAQEVIQHGLSLSRVLLFRVGSVSIFLVLALRGASIGPPLGKEEIPFRQRFEKQN